MLEKKKKKKSPRWHHAALDIGHAGGRPLHGGDDVPQLGGHLLGVGLVVLLQVLQQLQPQRQRQRLGVSLIPVSLSKQTMSDLSLLPLSKTALKTCLFKLQ